MKKFLILSWFLDSYSLGLPNNFSGSCDLYFHKTGFLERVYASASFVYLSSCNTLKINVTDTLINEERFQVLAGKHEIKVNPLTIFTNSEEFSFMFFQNFMKVELLFRFSAEQPLDFIFENQDGDKTRFYCNEWKPD